MLKNTHIVCIKIDRWYIILNLVQGKRPITLGLYTSPCNHLYTVLSLSANERTSGHARREHVTVPDPPIRGFSHFLSFFELI